VVEIAGALDQDERIVTNPPDSIGNGEEVRVMEAAGEKGKASPAQQPAEGPKDNSKSAEDVAKTGLDHKE